MKLSYHVHVRATGLKSEKVRAQARLKRKHGWRAILRGLAQLPVTPVPDGTRPTSLTIPSTGEQR